MTMHRFGRKKWTVQNIVRLHSYILYLMIVNSQFYNNTDYMLFLHQGITDYILTISYCVPKSMSRTILSCSPHNVALCVTNGYTLSCRSWLIVSFVSQDQFSSLIASRASMSSQIPLMAHCLVQFATGATITKNLYCATVVFMYSCRPIYIECIIPNLLPKIDEYKDYLELPSFHRATLFNLFLYLRNAPVFPLTRYSI